MIYDLDKRTSVFGINVIRFCKQLPIGIISSPLITQLVRAGTGVVANYSEADDAQSKKDFAHKICLCKKEAREPMHFLRMLAEAVPDAKNDAESLYREAKELNLIFNAIYKKVKSKTIHHSDKIIQIN
jgi:four helix bundle protein